METSLKRFNTENCDVVWKAVFDDRLDKTCIRILVLLSSRKGDEIYSTRGIGVMVGTSHVSVSKALNKLIEFKYIVKTCNYYRINSQINLLRKVNKSVKKSLQECKLKLTDSLTKVNTNKSKNNTNNETKNINNIYTKTDKPLLVKIGSHFKANQEQIDAFIFEDTRPVFDSRIEDINNYCAATGRRYKDYAAAYRTFRKKDRQRKTFTKPEKKSQHQLNLEALARIK